MLCTFVEVVLGFPGFNSFQTPQYFLSILWVSRWPHTCRSDGGSSVPRWPCSLLGRCAPAAGLSPGSGPSERSIRPALSDPVLLYRDYSGLSRPRAPQRAQEHPPQHRETVSIHNGGGGGRFQSAASFYAAHFSRKQIIKTDS